MPLRFPCKKEKTSSRISQMVKDQFHRRKNATSPLVVETGFPTSLVDLIVNHRDRFKKSSSHSLRSKKKNPPSPLPPPSIDDPVFVSPPQSPPSTSQNSPTLLIFPQRITVPNTGEQESDAASHRGELEDMVIRVEGAISNTEKPDRALVIVLKIFLMVVLALGTKKFALGITVSAFLLFFLEYLRKHVSRFLTPCIEAQERLGLMVMGAWSFVRTKMVRLEEEDCVFKARPRLGESLNLPGSSFVKSDGKISLIQEIEIVEPVCYFTSRDDEVRYGKEKSYEKSRCDWKLKCEEGELEGVMVKEAEVRCELSESKIGKSHKDKIKSKMKILLPKKFRNLRKKSKDLETELIPTGDGKFAVLEEKEEMEYHQEPGLEPGSELSETVNAKDSCDAISSSRGLFDGVVEMMEMGRDNSIERENYGYIVLLLIALLGLVGGRIFALVFILTWCFLSRSREAIRRSLKVLTVRSFTHVFRFNV